MNLVYRVTKQYPWDPTQPDTVIQWEGEIVDLDTGTRIGPPISMQWQSSGLQNELDPLQRCASDFEAEAKTQIESLNANPNIEGHLGLIATLSPMVGIDLKLSDDLKSKASDVLEAKAAEIALEVKPKTK